MKPGSPCQHCEVSGCAIYENRPVDPCRDFVCAWLDPDSPLPARLRPNECGAIILMNRQWQGRKVVRAVPVGKKIPAETFAWLQAYTRETSIPLLYCERIEKEGEFIGIRNFGFGPRSFVHAVKTELGPEDIIKL